MEHQVDKNQDLGMGTFTYFDVKKLVTFKQKLLYII